MGDSCPGHLRTSSKEISLHSSIIFRSIFSDWHLTGNQSEFFYVKEDILQERDKQDNFYIEKFHQKMY